MNKPTAGTAPPVEPNKSGVQLGSVPPAPITGWQRASLVLRLLWVRLRFVAILLIVALIVGYWDTIGNYWEKLTRPGGTIFGGVETVFGDRFAQWVWPQPVSAADPNTEYYCPMHPNVVRPGLDPTGAVPKCPICGMPLALRQKGAAATLPEGVISRRQLSPEQIQLAGIETAEVGYQPLTKELTTVGYVTYDDSRRSRIVTRVAGYLEKLYVDKPWIEVREGEPLAEIYSPELYSGARELLLALERGGNSDLAKSSRERLKLFGISDHEISELVEARRANHRLVIRSPRAGHIVQKDVLEGQHVDAGQSLFEVADLSKVWIEAEVYETDIPFLREEQEFEATVAAFANEVFRGTIALVHPHVNTATRTNAVRFELDNPDHKLRPGMFATVRINAPLSQLEPFNRLATETTDSSDGTERGKPDTVLAVPERAVIDTGVDRIVYVERTPGLFEGVRVKLGPRVGNFYPVVEGLTEGDRVAAAGAFLIDAETRLNPAAAATYMGSGLGATGSKQSSGADITRSTSSRRASAQAKKNIDKLAPADREEALAQRLCPVSDEPLGSMGVPHKIELAGQVVFVCCEGCEAEVRKDPAKYLEKIKSWKAANE